ncbi:hypothetical protein [Sphingomonas sp.]|uniref:hypothetical protein n=1 Tax=Sphingomonas sp. TaxID=28214 RepID=UPI002C0BA57B|nr:hypothetical protein [Sphingomonas sp.]HWK35661.1 hypothetical protein [Sphingomonas sp.]
MYRYLDRPVAALGPGESFLLWSIRRAAAAIAGKHCLGGALGPAFGRHDLESGLPHFAMAMALLLRDCDSPLEVMAPDAPQVSEHEALLLALFGATDTGAEQRVRDTLALLLSDGGVLTATHRAARSFTAALLAAGMAPPIPDSLTGEKPKR